MELFCIEEYTHIKYDMQFISSVKKKHRKISISQPLSCDKATIGENKQQHKMSIVQ